MLKSLKTALALVVASIIMVSAGTAFAFDNVLFFVNDPKELSFVEMHKIIAYCENYYRSIGLLKTQDVDKFFKSLSEHGAPNAKTAPAYVALVIQDASNPANASGAPCGVLAVKGQFDRAKVLDILKRHYTEHMTKTGHEAMFTENKSGDVVVHRFALPEKNRELTMLGFGEYSLFSSAAVGDTRLLKEVAKILQDNSARPNLNSEASVRYLLQLTSSDKEKLTKVIDEKYAAFKQQNVLLKRKGLRGFFSRRFADHKVKFVNSAVNELNDVEINIYRMRNDSVNMKRVSLVSNFENEEKARKVKQNILNHLNDAIKSATHPEDKLGLSNIKVTADGTKCSIDSELGSEEEQLQCFALISSYVARAMLRN